MARQKNKQVTKMKTVSSLNHLAIDGQETSGAINYLLGKVGCAWEDAPSAEQAAQMLEILNAEFEPEEGEELYWGAEGKVFEVVNGIWVAA